MSKKVDKALMPKIKAWACSDTNLPSLKRSYLISKGKGVPTLSMQDYPDLPEKEFVDLEAVPLTEGSSALEENQSVPPSNSCQDLFCPTLLSHHYCSILFFPT
ncbi:hypothetical protein U1Q18_015452 [Sarracenia purpurea var. burkii]